MTAATTLQRGKRPARASKKVHDSAAFRRWFGQSKVVDAQGQPLVVYHGTHHPVFSRFDAQCTADGAFHFGTAKAAWGAVEQNPDAEYGEDNPHSDNPLLMPVYLSIENPMRVADQDDDWAQAIARAKREGYDGIVYKNAHEDRGKDSYIAFRPEQIKSATGNRGRFDPREGDILCSQPTSRRPIEVEVLSPTSVRAWVGKKVVGAATAWMDSRDKFVILKSYVSPPFRRRGAAAAMYRAIEQHSGKQLAPAISLSDDAFEFWKRYRPEAVAYDLRHWTERIVGQRAVKRDGRTGVISQASGGIAVLLLDGHTDGTWTHIHARDLNDALAAAGSPTIDALEGLRAAPPAEQEPQPRERERA